MKKILLLLSLVLTISLFGAAPTSYYDSAEGKADNILRYALQSIIDGHTVVSYNNLYDVYETSDNTAAGKVWDMYSSCTWSHGSKTCGKYSTVCDCYNREHSVPQSWFSEASPMKSDAFHVYPTDGKVNGQRSNYQFGECSAGVSVGSKALGRLGSCTFPSGYSSLTVFEPDDQYKGDFARTYFYMATRYADICGGWGNAFNATAANAGLSKYSIALFLKWHRQDPVSQKEKDRNEAVYARQKNRNPFIDYPDLAEYIWGDNKGQAWYKNNTAIDQLDQSWISVFPNPATDFIAINAKDVTVLTYQLLDLSGKILQSGTAVSNDHIALNQFANGVYILQVNADNKSILQKIIINR